MPAAVARHRWWLPRFSLRFLLAAVSAFGIGFPLWYRWPYEERIEAHSDPYCGFRYGAIATTWQRQWGGGRVKQGWETEFDTSGKPRYRTYYRRDQRDGPYEQFDSSGRVCLRGQFAANASVGIWTANGDLDNSRWEYLDGKRHGEFLYTSPSQTLRLHFDRGKLVSVNGETPQLNADVAAWLLLAEQLDSRPGIPAGEFVETPLEDAAAFMSQTRRNTLYFVSPELDPAFPINYAAPHFELTLREELTVITQVHGLALRGRYGGICFTMPDDNGPWRDPTGVEDLALPLESPWRKAWELPAELHIDDLSLQAALSRLLSPQGLTFDASRIGPKRIWISIPSRPLHDALAILLYQSGCRCELVNGTLVIYPQFAQGSATAD